MQERINRHLTEKAQLGLFAKDVFGIFDPANELGHVSSYQFRESCKQLALPLLTADLTTLSRRFCRADDSSRVSYLDFLKWVDSYRPSLNVGGNSSGHSNTGGAWSSPSPSPPPVVIASVRPPAPPPLQTVFEEELWDHPWMDRMLFGTRRLCATG